MNLVKPYKKASVDLITTYYSPIHKAIDWRSKYGMPLVAPEDGIVTRILGGTYTPNDTMPLARGYVIEITSGDTRHEYWHILPYTPVLLGDTVKRGQIVAYMGNSGNVLSGGHYVPINERTQAPFAGTHLHQNMITDGEYINSLLYMDLREEPAYTIMDELSAASKTLKNMLASLVAYRE